MGGTVDEQRVRKVILPYLEMLPYLILGLERNLAVALAYQELRIRMVAFGREDEEGMLVVASPICGGNCMPGGGNLHWRGAEMQLSRTERLQTL